MRGLLVALESGGFAGVGTRATGGSVRALRWPSGWGGQVDVRKWWIQHDLAAKLTGSSSPVEASRLVLRRAIAAFTRRCTLAAAASLESYPAAIFPGTFIELSHLVPDHNS